MADQQVQRIEVQGLHGAYDVTVDLHPGLTILFGRNGSLKTTVLHFAANCLEGDFDRLLHVTFRRFKLTFYDGRTIEAEQSINERERKVFIIASGPNSFVLEVSGGAPSASARSHRSPVGPRPVYVPAFRTILDAVSRQRYGPSHTYGAPYDTEAYRELVARESRYSEETDVPADGPRALRREVAEATALKTTWCRDWFGPFVPVIRAPSLGEVSDALQAELQQAQFVVARSDRGAFTRAFTDVLETVLSGSTTGSTRGTDEVLKAIREHLASLLQGKSESQSAYQNIAEILKAGGTSAPIDEIALRVLDVYDRVLNERVHAQRKAFQRIQVFAESVNRFLIDKEMSLDLEATTHRARFSRFLKSNRGRRFGLSVLSSGERHIVTLLFAATHMSRWDGVLLIDEPEISLHIDWQRILVSELARQAEDRQLVICTHSPEVAAEHRGHMVKLEAVEVDEPDRPSLFPGMDRGAEPSTGEI